MFLRYDSKLEIKKSLSSFHLKHNKEAYWAITDVN